MGIGNLDVSVTGTTRHLRDELKALRNDLGATGAAALKADRDFTGNTLGDFKKKFGGGKPPAPVLPPLREADLWRSQVVSLTRETSRYNEVAKTQVGTLKGLKQSLGAMKTGIAGVAAAPAAFSIGFDFGQKIRGYIQDIHSAKDAWQQLGAVLGQNQSIEDEFIDKMARLQQIIDAEGRAKTAAAEKERQMYKDFEKDKRNAALDIQEAMGANVDRQALDDHEKYGGQRAFELAEMRREAARQELNSAEKKEQAEKRAAELAARKEKAEEAHRKNRIEDAKTVADLEKQNRQFWMSDKAKRRDDVLSSIEDPKQRARAAAQLEKLEVAEWVKNNRKEMASNLKDLSGRNLSAVDYDSREGHRQRVATSRESDISKIARRQLSAQERTAAAVETLAANGGGRRAPARI